ncbi:MAG: hypothetical protein IID13_07145 [Candidatus Marinimicrobia bacterium]|nr:hypothetical protein [Candidatus Neomarinimicrobiota bacterium]
MPGFEALLNIHPLFVHFPIAITIMALVFEGASRLNKDKFPPVISTALIYSAALAAIVTVVTGLNAADTLGHDSPGHDLVHIHRDFMLYYTAFIVVLAVANFIIAKKAGDRLAGTWGKMFRPGLLIMATAILVVGTDIGGQLVFKHGVGVQLPETMSTGQALPGQEPAAGSDSAKVVEPHDDGHDHVH